MGSKRWREGTGDPIEMTEKGLGREGRARGGKEAHEKGIKGNEEKERAGRCGWEERQSEKGLGKDEGKSK